MSSEDLFEEIPRPELIFALVGPIGVDMDEVQAKLQDALRSVRYDAKFIHLTKVLRDYEHTPIGPSLPEGYREKINRANSFRLTANDPAALAGLAILEVKKARAEHVKSLASGTKSEADQGVAYVIRQLKRPEEVALLRGIYGEKFVQISVALDYDKRLQNLVRKLSQERPQLSEGECDTEARHLMRVDENEADNSFGQRVDDIFHLGDFFLEAGSSEKVASELGHLISAFFGDNSKSPRKDEFGAYLAAAAALRSADLSRQVGAAILTPDGEVISLGCNEVPKAFGGNYWYDDANKARDFERGAEQNSIEKRRIIVDFLSRLASAGIKVPGLDSCQGLEAAIDDALVSDITEYGRMTHAEMSAICDAARNGLPIKGATLYVTTFPCHNCAKHVLASGIARVVYVEPYAKSRAATSHRDSISLSNVNDKVRFQHFHGIAPSRFEAVFKKGRRRKGSTLLKWYEDDEPRPRISQRDSSHIHREGRAARRVIGSLASGFGKPEEPSEEQPGA